MRVWRLPAAPGLKKAYSESGKVLRTLTRIERGLLWLQCGADVVGCGLVAAAAGRVADMQDHVGDRGEIEVVVARVEHQVPGADRALPFERQPPLVAQIHLEEPGVSLPAARGDGLRSRCAGRGERPREDRSVGAAAPCGSYEVPGACVRTMALVRVSVAFTPV